MTVRTPPSGGVRVVAVKRDHAATSYCILLDHEHPYDRACNLPLTVAMAATVISEFLRHAAGMHAVDEPRQAP